MSEIEGKLKTLAFPCQLNTAPRSEEPYYDGVIATTMLHFNIYITLAI